MTVANELLIDGLGRIRENVEQVVAGLSEEQLASRPDEHANSIAWLVWHLTRIEDDHVADVAGAEQVWTTGAWHERFGLPFDARDTGYGHGPTDVAAVRVSAELLAGYQDAVHNACVDYVKTLEDDDYARVVDTRWEPPVTLAVRLVSVVDDAAQHVGQAAYRRGLLGRR